MKKYSLLILLFFTCFLHAENLASIYEILKEVESNNNPQAIGDNGKAYGLLQIHKICVDDVNRIYKTSYKHAQMFQEACAQEVFILYLNHGIARYKHKYQATPTTQDIVRMWNGGIYTGYKNPKTLIYYKRYLKFKSIMKTQTLIGDNFEIPSHWLEGLNQQRQMLAIHQKAQDMELRTIKEALKTHLGRKLVLEDGLLCHKSYYLEEPTKFALFYKNEELGLVETVIAKSSITCVFTPKVLN